MPIIQNGLYMNGLALLEINQIEMANENDEYYLVFPNSIKIVAKSKKVRFCGFNELSTNVWRLVSTLSTSRPL